MNPPPHIDHSGADIPVSDRDATTVDPSARGVGALLERKVIFTIFSLVVLAVFALVAAAIFYAWWSTIMHTTTGIH